MGISAWARMACPELRGSSTGGEEKLTALERWISYTDGLSAEKGDEKIGKFACVS